MGEPMDMPKRVFGMFEEAFPTIKVATILSYEVGKGVHTLGIDESQRRTFGLRLREGLIRCSNPGCRRGGYEIDASVYEMVREKLNENIFERSVPATTFLKRVADRGVAVEMSFTIA